MQIRKHNRVPSSLPLGRKGDEKEGNHHPQLVQTSPEVHRPEIAPRILALWKRVVVVQGKRTRETQGRKGEAQAKRTASPMLTHTDGPAGLTLY